MSARAFLKNEFRFFLAAAFLGFLPTFFIPFLHIDEGNWAAMSQYIFSGDFYRGLSDNKPPFLMELFWLFSMGGNSMIALHICTALWTMVGGIFFYRILTEHFPKFCSRQEALWGSLLLITLSGLINYGAFSAELAISPFLIIATELALRLKKEKTSLAYGLLIGLCISAAVNIKPTAVFLSLIPIVLCFRSKHGFQAIVFGFLAGVGMTALSWLSVQAPLRTIWHEAFELNFQYVKFNNFKNAEASWDVFKNILVALFLAYASATLGSIGAGFALIRSTLKDKKYTTHHFTAIVLSLFLLAMTIVTVSYGRRFFQQYFVAALPCLAFFSVYSVGKFGKRWQYFLSSLALISLIGFHSKIFYLQAQDKNKNWDSKIEKLITEIKKDTLPTDTIWISNTPGSAYFESDRKPAVKYYLFLHINHFVVICRSEDAELKEDLNFPLYQEALQSLETNKPKVIFWTQRASNSCSDRLKISQYPSIEKLLASHYEKIWENDLGIYFRRKS
ncbi:MAG: glycosyltransferase family 39 protein [Deltaproteobacteria bacterium]|nr:glycosyltransferase family 39 protein [Deltaproteobacteria bacterium]